jgi:hypothetical protein
MGFVFTRLVYESSLPSRLKPVCAMVAHLARDRRAGDDRPAGLVFASVKRMATYLGVNERHCRRLLRDLERAGLLVVVERGGGRRRFGGRLAGVRTTYQFRPDRLPGYPDSYAPVAETYPDVCAPVTPPYPDAYAPVTPGYPDAYAPPLMRGTADLNREKNLAIPERSEFAGQAPPNCALHSRRRAVAYADGKPMCGECFAGIAGDVPEQEIEMGTGTLR